jgi:hypothetical protein
LRIALPPISEQRRIVEILDQADALRKLRAEADAKAERILPALFLKMLGSPRTWGSHFNASKMGDVVDLISGATPSKNANSFWVGSVPWVSPKDMKRDFLFPIVIPNNEQCLAFERVVEWLRTFTASRESCKEHLERLFTLLLHQAFNGSLTATWREAHMTELLQEMEHQAKSLDAAGVTA